MHAVLQLIVLGVTFLLVAVMGFSNRYIKTVRALALGLLQFGRWWSDQAFYLKLVQYSGMQKLPNSLYTVWFIMSVKTENWEMRCFGPSLWFNAINRCAVLFYTLEKNIVYMHVHTGYCWSRHPVSPPLLSAVCRDAVLQHRQPVAVTFGAFVILTLIIHNEDQSCHWSLYWVTQWILAFLMTLNFCRSTRLQGSLLQMAFDSCQWNLVCVQMYG